MRIEVYFQQIRHLIENNLIVSSSNVTYDKRATHEGFIQGILYLIDGSECHIREFVDETKIDRFTYAYQDQSVNFSL